MPRNVQFGGLAMDVDYASHQTVDKQNSQQGWINYNRAIGSRYSAMEHLVPEQMFSTDEAPAQGISAVKAIALASAEGQRIYTITSSNLYTAMAQLQLSGDTEQEIQNAVEAGFEVTTHQYQINFNGWVGEGYIIIDPNTGAGAYKIAGGGNGAEIAGNVLGVWSTIIGFQEAALIAIKAAKSILLRVGIYGAILSYLSLLASLVRLSATCGLIAIPIMMAMIFMTSLLIYLSVTTGGIFVLLFSQIVLNAASFFIGQLSDVCKKI